MISHISSACYMFHSSYTLRFYHPKNIWLSAQVMKLLIMQSSPTSRHSLLLRSKYSPQHPVLKYPQSMFFP